MSVLRDLKEFANESITLFNVSGVPCRISNAWIIYMIGLGLFLFAKEDESYAGLIFLSTIIAYVSVILHEYGHALVSQRFGGVDIEITIYPYSGLASGDLNSIHKAGLFWTIFAGPAVNATLAILGWIGMFFLADNARHFCSVVIAINTAMAFLNIIPLYPLDGGRISKIFLQQFMGDMSGFRMTLMLSTAIYLCASIISYQASHFVFPVVGLLLLISGWLEFFEDKQNAIAAENEEMKAYFLEPIHEASKSLSPAEVKIFSDLYFARLESLEGQADQAVAFRTAIMEMGRESGWKSCVRKVNNVLR